MDFDRIVVADRSQYSLVMEDLHRLQIELPKFPSGYLEYVQRFGKGCLGNLTIATPFDLFHDPFSSIECWRKHFEEYWFWTNDVLTQKQATEAIKIASSDDGDAYLVHPHNPDVVFRLEHEGRIVASKNGIYGLIDERIGRCETEEQVRKSLIFHGF